MTKKKEKQYKTIYGPTKSTSRHNPEVTGWIINKEKTKEEIQSEEIERLNKELYRERSIIWSETKIKNTLDSLNYNIINIGKLIGRLVYLKESESNERDSKE